MLLIVIVHLYGGGDIPPWCLSVTWTEGTLATGIALVPSPVAHGYRRDPPLSLDSHCL
jgi:hypothetical protein